MLQWKRKKMLETPRLLRLTGAQVKINHVERTLITPGVHKVNMEKWRVNPRLILASAILKRCQFSQRKFTNAVQLQ